MPVGKEMTYTPEITAEQIRLWLQEIPDPEIPVLSITDLGIVREVMFDPERPRDCTVTITPTYSGCPATEVIAAGVRQTLAAHGLTNITMRTQLAPAWTTEWLSEKGRQRLREYGIAPPSATLPLLTQITLPAKAEAVACPLCGSARTEVVSQYGSTPCKSLYRCMDCREPFDYFKPH